MDWLIDWWIDSKLLILSRCSFLNPWAPCMDPAAGCGASRRWCKNQHHQQLVWEHLGTLLRVSTLRKMVAEDCWDWINHVWAEPECTGHEEELQNRYAASLSAPTELFKTCSLSIICKNTKFRSTSFIIFWQFKNTTFSLHENGAVQFTET